MAEILFWSAVGLIAFTYAGYPLSLLLFPRSRFRSADAGDCPTVSLLIAAHNERDCIAATLENKLQLDYPAKRLEI